MKRRNVVFTVIAVLVAITAMVIIGCTAQPSLIVHLRCDEQVSGTLSANVILPDGEREKAKSFDINKICKDGKIKLGGYQREQELHFTYENDRGDKSELDSTYGPNIQSDQSGYYVVLKITNASPFIANDNI